MEVLIPVAVFMAGLYWLGTWFDKKGRELDQRPKVDHQHVSPDFRVKSPFGNLECSNSELARQVVKLAITNFESEIESIKSISPDVFKTLVNNKDQYQLLSMSMHIALITYVFQQKIRLSSDYYDTVIGQFNKPDEVAFKINSYLAELEIDEEKAIDVFIRDVMTAFGGNGLVVDFTAIASLMRSSHFDALNLYKNEISIE